MSWPFNSRMEPILPPLERQESGATVEVMFLMISSTASWRGLLVMGAELNRPEPPPVGNAPLGTGLGEALGMGGAVPAGIVAAGAGLVAALGSMSMSRMSKTLTS